MFSKVICKSKAGKTQEHRDFIIHTFEATFNLCFMFSIPFAHHPYLLPACSNRRRSRVRPTGKEAGTGSTHTRRPGGQLRGGRTALTALPRKYPSKELLSLICYTLFLPQIFHTHTILPASILPPASLPAM